MDVIGVTLQLYASENLPKRKGACCAGQDIYDAKAVAERIGIAHYTLDYAERFRRSVMEDFAASYARGETPIPCVRCNETVKFRDLLAAAQDMGAEALITGHYSQRLEGQGGPELHRAIDASRDQSYFLFATTRAQLDYVRFPLGELPKSETRAIAGELGLGVAEKPDSQDICFVPDGRYSDVVAKLKPGAIEPGEIVDLSGPRAGSARGCDQLHRRAAQGARPFASRVAVRRAHRRGEAAGRGRVRARRWRRSAIFLRDMNWLDVPLIWVRTRVPCSHACAQRANRCKAEIRAASWRCRS